MDKVVMGFQNDLRDKYMLGLRALYQDSATTHTRLLQQRSRTQNEIASLLSRQISTLNQKPGALFLFEDLNEFASGDIVKCLGPGYAVYNGRRSPRIPNGALLLMTRILTIQGARHQFDQPASILAEYDVPKTAWFFPQNATSKCQLPLSICMEISLQPCGFLSAFLETPLRFPNEDYYFRNLDGEATYTDDLDVRGRTIRASAVLEKTIFSGRTIIQEFTFELSCEGRVFFIGRSSFGYFPAQAMASQAGLDGGISRHPWIHDKNPRQAPQPIQAENSHPSGDAAGTNHVLIDRQGGLYAVGYVYSTLPISPNDWFFACHFYQDPVMPGSLGVEAMVNAVKQFARIDGNGCTDVQIALGEKITWKYRGQVLPENKEIQLEAHLRSCDRSETGVKCRAGEASLWVDGKRIYEIHNLALVSQSDDPGKIF